MGCPTPHSQPSFAAAYFERKLRAAEPLAAGLSSAVARPPHHAAGSGHTPPVEREASQIADSFMIEDCSKLNATSAFEVCEDVCCFFAQALGGNLKYAIELAIIFPQASMTLSNSNGLMMA